MPVLKLAGFRGEQPRIIPRQLPDSGAQVARNIRLDDGGLTPIRRSMQVGAAGTPDPATILKFGGTWLSFPAPVCAAEGPVDTTRLYYTGDGIPKMRVGATTYPLAVPRPATPLTAALGGAGAGDITTRIYVYTWVTGFGEESEPCAASNAIDWKPGNTVTLSGFAATPADRNITKQRIYRSQTGTTGTYFYLIAERDASSADFSDTVAVDAFQEPLPSADWNPPPDGLQGLVPMANGMAAGFVGRSVYFAEPYRWHAWPEKYMRNVDADIVGLAAIDSVLFILTKGHPHFAVGALPEAIQIDRSPGNFACVGARGIVNLGFAVCYPTNDGLAIARADGSVGLASTSLFSPEQWKTFDPATIIGSQHQGRYVGFYDAPAASGRKTGAMAIEVAADPGFLAFSDATATAAFYDLETATLNYVPKGSTRIVRFDDPAGARAPMYWKSKPFILPYPENFGAIIVESDTQYTEADTQAAAAYRAEVVAENAALLALGGVNGEVNAAPVNGLALNGDILTPLPPLPNSLQVSVMANEKTVAVITSTNRIQRLPSGFKAEKWEIDVSGDIAVTQIKMAKTVQELGSI